MRTSRVKTVATVVFLLTAAANANAEDWLQFKYDCRHSGNAADRTVSADLGLIGAVPLTDAVFTAPVIADGRIYVVDGSGVASCVDASTLRILWKSEKAGDNTNCNNVSSPAIAGRFLHFGTMSGHYYVLDKTTGDVVKKIDCGEPILSSPVVANGRVYFATLGSQVHAVEPDGAICWKWDFVKEVLKFDGDRWSGQQWCEHKGGKVTWRDQFCCAIDIAVSGRTVVVPVAGSLVCLEDRGKRAELRASPPVPRYAGSEKPAIFGLSIADDGAAYVQWHRRDNTGRVEIMELEEEQGEAEFVSGTLTEINRPGLLSFCSVSIRGRDVYRCRPEEGFGFCKHSPDSEQAQYLGGYPSIASPILLRDKAVYGGLDGSLYIVPLSGKGKTWSFKTAFGKAISAPVAVCDGRIYFGCEDGYLYILGPKGKAPRPLRDLQTQKIRSLLTGRLADSKYDWFTNFGNQRSTNSNDQGLKPPLKVNWIRRYKGTFKHMPVCGGGRMYTHTAEGQIFAVEQETGRLLWRRYWPGVHVSFTGPLYYKERLIVPQAG
ncbi:MAG: outer membrane protein assembly factor BamB family protein, partial [Planctomycetota bacterium]